MPIEQFQTMLDSNYVSCVYMAHAILNAWLRPVAVTGAEHPSGVQAHDVRVRSTKHQPPLPARHLIFAGSFVSYCGFAGFAP